MKKNKYIKQIANNLPVVVDSTVSGFYQDFDENGEEKLFPNVVNHPINHERRLRKAYEKLGMEGIKQYLNTIYNLQIQYNDLQNLQQLQHQEVQVDGKDALPEHRPDPSETIG